AVVARVAVVAVGASGPRAAAVVSADIVVVAVRRWAADAAATATRIGRGARTAVVARVAVVGMCASGRGVATVVSASVVIVTVDRTAHAGVIDAGLGGRALIGCGAVGGRVAAAADPRLRGAGGGHAGIPCAGVAVVAVGRPAGRAAAATTGIAARAGVAVVARVAVVGVGAARAGVAAVVGARVAIVAVGR